MARDKANRRMDNPSDNPDFTSYILKYNGTEKGMTRKEIGDNASILIIAGSETVLILPRAIIVTILTLPRLHLF